MVLNLAGELNYDMFNNLIKAFNSLAKSDNLHIYFSSEGGFVDVAEAIIDFINKNKDYIGITFYGEVFSAGMLVFLKTGCYKTILPDTRGMFHFSYQDMTISEGGKPSAASDIFSLKEMKESKQRTIEYLKTTKLLEKEIKNIKMGKEVYFSFARMREIIS